MALTGSKVLSLSTQHWTRRSCRCSAPSTAGLCSCLWRCLLRFGGLPPPARPSVTPILDAVIKTSPPPVIILGPLCPLLHPQPGWQQAAALALAARALEHMAFALLQILDQVDPPEFVFLIKQEPSELQRKSKRVRGFESRTCFITEDFKTSLLHFIKPGSLLTPEA